MKRWANCVYALDVLAKSRGLCLSEDNHAFDAQLGFMLEFVLIMAKNWQVLSVISCYTKEKPL